METEFKKYFALGMIVGGLFMLVVFITIISNQ